MLNSLAGAYALKYIHSYHCRSKFLIFFKKGKWKE
jgi:hypothetical protein